MESWAIDIRGGMGDLKFGASETQVRALLGEPDEIEDNKSTGGKWWNWRYDRLGLDLSMDEDYGNRLFSIWCDNPKLTLRGESLIGKTYVEILHLLPVLCIGEPKIEDLVGGQCWELEFDPADLSMVFDDNTDLPREEHSVTAVSWMAGFADDGDTVLWPE